MAPHSAPLRIARRWVTLLRLFLVASALILAAGAVLLTARLTRTLRAQAIAGEVDSATLFANAVLSPSIVRGDRLSSTTPRLVRVGRTIRVPVNVRSLNAWTLDGTLALT